MSDPRFEPRECTGARTLFGRVLPLPWVDDDELPEGVTAAQADAARIQHAYAFVIKQRIKKAYESQAEYARTAGSSQERLSNVLRGAAIMRLEDMALAHRLLGGVHQEAMRAVLSGAIDTTKQRGTH
ncbi:helix-turn-helix domain-containing protein [Aeromicrobium sp. CF4.19]|uniref:helix-turn-helix domain-containing protein n=1 Tax=Aeromicrobium sp. CF4.19 TaxID=3373082 RepID=UPI003EE806D0